MNATRDESAHVPANAPRQLRGASSPIYHIDELAFTAPTPGEAENYTKAILDETAQALQPSYFQNQRIGSFRLVFLVDGEPVKAKKSDGYVSLKLRHRDRLEVGYFVVESDVSLPTKRALHQQIEQYYSRQKDVRVKQIHLEAHLDDR